MKPQPGDTVDICFRVEGLSAQAPQMIYLLFGEGADEYRIVVPLETVERYIVQGEQT